MNPLSLHPLGTDAVGRDVALRLIAAAKPLLLGGGIAVAVAFTIGVTLGAVAGARGGSIGQTIRAAATSVAAIPAIPLVLVLGLVIGQGAAPLGLAWGLACAPGVGVAIFHRVDALRREDRLLALVAHGVPTWRAVAVHLVWNNARDVLRMQAARALAGFLAMECALSYLGSAGVAEPEASWGNMLAMAMRSGDGAGYAASLPVIAPVVAPVVAIVGVSALLWRAAQGPAVRAEPGLHERRASQELHDGDLGATNIEVRNAVRDAARNADRRSPALAHLDALHAHPGEVVALIGPSGSGKSLILRAIAGIVPAALIASGRITRPRLAWVAQDARASLDPLRTVRAQADAGPEALTLSGFPAARLDAFPHALSGGEAQRAALLVAVAPRGAPPPALLLADEPTTGLDPRARRSLTRALRALTRSEAGPAVLFVTHDQRLLPGFADRIVPVGSPETPPGAPAPLAPSPRAPSPLDLTSTAPLLAASGLCVWPGLTRSPRRNGRGAPLLRGIDLHVHAGETVCLVGESGSGKTSLLRALNGLCASTGTLTLLGADPRGEPSRRTQMLWQDPGTSLDPTLPLHRLLAISERLGRERDTVGRTVDEALRKVDLTHRAEALAGELSGGEQRRASLAQIWLTGARVVLADEPTAGLDAARAAEALTLLRAIVGAEGGILVASHDLTQVLPLCHRVYVLHEGACVDAFTPSDAADAARHPFTRDLLDAG